MVCSKVDLPVPLRHGKEAGLRTLSKSNFSLNADLFKNDIIAITTGMRQLFRSANRPT